MFRTSILGKQEVELFPILKASCVAVTRKSLIIKLKKNVRVTAGPASHYYWKKTGCFATFLPFRVA